MTARTCFSAKIAAGRVSRRAGQQLLDMLDDFEEDARSREPGVGGVTGPGVFPEGLVAQSDQPGVP